MSTQEVTVPPLNDQQATGILTEAINRGMMEGGIPPDEPTRLSYAQQLVSQAKLAWDSGNQSESVTAVLFIAEVDMNPQIAAVAAPAPQPIAPPPGIAPQVPVPSTPPIAAPPAPPQSPSFDLTTLGDDAITRMIQVLQGPEHASNPNVQAELTMLQAEQQRRAGGVSAQAPQTQAIPPQAPPVAPPAAPPTSPAPQPAAAAPVPAPIPGPPGVPPSAFAPGPPATDAPAAPGVPLAQPQQEGAVPQAQPTSEDGERAALQSQLTIAALRAHGIDPAEAGTLSIESLRFVVENPGGPVATTTTATTPDSSDSQVSSAREALVEQITGPMLKAYGRGRRDIPGIGDNEILLMIQNPDGKIDPSQLTAARSADAAGQQVTSVPPPQPSQSPLSMAAPPASVAPPVPSQAPPAPSPQAPATAAFAPPIAPPDPAAVPPQAPAPMPDSPNPVAFSPVAAAAGAPGGGWSPPQSQATVPPMAPPVGAPPVTANAAQEKAMAIIAAENMPIPPEIDGDPPRLPNDLSKAGDQELFSFHAQFHACEVRMNWVISQQEDALGDAQKLLRNRRREVLLTIPATVEGKKVTKEIKEAMAEDDAEVQQYRSQVEEMEEMIGKLRVLRDGYHQDVSTCSRQWSMRSGEADKQPR